MPLVKKKPGPESKYREEFCEDIVEWMGQGYTLTTFPQHLKRKYGIDVIIDTIYDWIRKHPEFKEAHGKAKVASQALFEELLLMATKGVLPVELKQAGSKGISLHGLMFIMRARFPADYGQVYKVTSEMDDKLDKEKLEGRLRLRDLTDETLKLMIRDGGIKERNERNGIPEDVEHVRGEPNRGGRTKSRAAPSRIRKKFFLGLLNGFSQTSIGSHLKKIGIT